MHVAAGVTAEARNQSMHAQVDGERLECELGRAWRHAMGHGPKPTVAACELVAPPGGCFDASNRDILQRGASVRKTPPAHVRYTHSDEPFHQILLWNVTAEPVLYFIHGHVYPWQAKGGGMSALARFRPRLVTCTAACSYTVRRLLPYIRLFFSPATHGMPRHMPRHCPGTCP